MPLLRSSLLDTSVIENSEIYTLFSKVQKIREAFARGQRLVETSYRPVVGLLFFEPSTRTRTSFQIAAYRLGLDALYFDFAQNSSLHKGESHLDTLLNIAAMRPDLLVVRYGSDSEIEAYLKEMNVPVVNAGSGVYSHPTQALLDAFTIFEERGQIAGERILILGDILHSRVARSNIELLGRLGAQIQVFGPKAFLPDGESDLTVASSLEDGLKWSTVCMSLRVQTERHVNAWADLSGSGYLQSFGLDQNRLQIFSESGIVMHPGPVNWGVEMQQDILNDRRCRILKQVENGVYVRAALLTEILGLEL